MFDPWSIALREPLLILRKFCIATSFFAATAVSVSAQGPAGRTCNTVDPPVSHWSADVKLGSGSGFDFLGGGSVEYSINPFAGAGLQALYGVRADAVDVVGYGSLNLSNLTAPFRKNVWGRTNVFVRGGAGARLTGSASMLVLAGLSGEYNISDMLAFEMGSDLLYGPEKSILVNIGLRYKFGVLSLKHARTISMNEYRPQPSPIIIRRTEWVGNDGASFQRLEALEHSNDSLQTTLKATEELLKLIVSQEAARTATKAVNKPTSIPGVAVKLPVAVTPTAHMEMAVAPAMEKKDSVIVVHSAPQLKVPNVVTGTTNPVEFLSGSSQLTPDSKLILNEMATILRAKEWKNLTIIGNTDNQGYASNNKALSLKRAIIVRDYLISKGLPLSKLKVRGDGGVNPIDSNKTLLGRRLNRRIDFVLE
jgi:OOP family OmpA-OmpF porin